MTMKLFDISKEVFSASVFPGDPAPSCQPVLELSKGAACNLTQLTLGSHSATHMDAPSHFVPGGRTIDQVDLRRCVGPCRVMRAEGLLTEEWAAQVMDSGVKRLLIQGEITLSSEAAQVLARRGLLLIGVEGMTVGPVEDTGPVHRALLEGEVAILESCVLEGVAPGEYFLAAQPIKYGGLDGAQVRPLLIQMD